MLVGEYDCLLHALRAYFCIFWLWIAVDSRFLSVLAGCQWKSLFQDKREAKCITRAVSHTLLAGGQTTLGFYFTLHIFCEHSNVLRPFILLHHLIIFQSLAIAGERLEFVCYRFFFEKPPQNPWKTFDRK